MKSIELLLIFLFIYIVYLAITTMDICYVIGIICIMFSVLSLNNYTYYDYEYIKNDNSFKKHIKNELNADIIKDNNINNINNDINNINDILLEKYKDELKADIIKDRCAKNIEYSENNYKYNLLDELGSLGDNNIAHLMKHMSNKNRVAIDNMSRQNKYTNIKYFQDELNDQADSRWWDDDDLENEFKKSY